MPRTPLAIRALVGLVALAAGCGGQPEPAARAPATAAPAPGSQAATGIALPRARVLFDAPSSGSLVAERGDVRLHLDARARIAISADGRLDRGKELLPRGQARALELPARLGGGWLFAVVGGAGSQIFRAESWTAPLEPLLSTPSVLDLEQVVVPGFDRLYVRIKSQNLLVPIEARTGAPTSLGPLPPAAAHGDMVFADGWRAVVDTDLRGLLATFDAGATWRPVPLAGPVRLSLVGGDPVIAAPSGRFALRGDGRLSPLPSQEGGRPTSDGPREDPPLGPVPLRAALEDGWPDSAESIVVARRGALARVSMSDGGATFLDLRAFPDVEAHCHAMPLGRGIGFACGEPERGTVVYQLVRGEAGDRAIGMREVLRFAEARRVSPSGNGAAVIDGPCSDDPAPADARVHCVRDVRGATREVRLRGAAGSERVVALGDGRVAVLLPPSGERGGQLTLLDGDRATHVPLVFSDRPIERAEPPPGASVLGPPEGRRRAPPRRGAPADGGAEEPLDPIVRGTWLHGPQEVEPGVLAGWIEGGGPVASYRVTLDGRVELGDVVEEDAALLSGPFGLVLDASGRAVETTDFGRTWTERELPPIPLGARDVPRGCGPAGCALPSVLRVGWGEPRVAGDLAVAPEPQPLPVPPDRLAQRPLTLGCTIASGPHDGAPAAEARPPGPSRPPAAPPRPPPPRPRPARPSAAAPAPAVESPTPNGWQPLRGVAPPTLAPGETGFDAGQPFEQVAMRAYAWGSRAAWARTGRWLVRFDDRFDPRGVRSTRPTVTPWSIDTVAADQFGAGSHAYATTWAASLDPGGATAIVSGCTGRVCALFLAEDGGALLPLRDEEGQGFARPSGPVAQVGRTTWFLGLAPTPRPGGDPLHLHRAESGLVRRLAPLARPQPPRFAAPTPARLARRARTDEVGLVTTLFAGPNDRRGRFVVVPVLSEDGELGEPVDLGRADLADRALRPCEPADDGWVLDVPWDRPPAVVHIDGAPPGGAPRVGSVEARVRIEPGSFCVERLAGTTDAVLPRGGARGDGAVAGSLPLAVSHRGTGERWGLSCRARP